MMEEETKDTNSHKSIKDAPMVHLGSMVGEKLANAVPIVGNYLNVLRPYHLVTRN